MLEAELNSMQRWAYYGIEDDYLIQLLKEDTFMTDTLTLSETQQLTSLETVIETGLETFVQVGQALMEIRDKRLYRERHATFGDYCHQRWGFQRAHAYRMIEAAQVVSNLSPIGDTPKPANEAQTRPLVSLPPEWQREAWQRAVETAPEGRVTERHVRQVVEELYGQTAGGIANAHPTFPPPKEEGIRAAISQEMQVLLSHESTEWYTPAKYIEAAREVMGGIDLDPATAMIPQEWIKATVFYTIKDNGLEQPWLGRTWLNPPYSKTGNMSNQEIWAAKLITEYQAGRVNEALLLVKASIGYDWFDRLFYTYPVCLLRGLISFIKPDGQINGPAKLGSAIFYFGPNLARFEQVFERHGRVLLPPLSRSRYE